MYAGENSKSKISMTTLFQIWEIHRAEAYLNNNTEINHTQLLREENVYIVIHMLLIFWIPATIVVVSIQAISVLFVFMLLFCVSALLSYCFLLGLLQLETFGF